MQRSPLVLGLAAVFAGMTAVLFVLAAVFRDVLVLFVAVPFAVATYFFWYQATGRLAAKVRSGDFSSRFDRRADGSARGFGAGPRDRREARTRFGREARQAGQRRRARTAGGGPTAGPGQGPGAGTAPGGGRIDSGSGPTRREAYRTLGLDPGADEDEVRRAYREKVKEVHPDRGGSEAEFKRVTEAYERLTD